MSPLPEKNRIMLDFFNKIRYFFSTSARYNCAFNQHKKFHPFFSFLIRLPRSPTPQMRSSLFIRLCRDRMGEVFCIIHKNRINKVVTSLMREKNNQKGDLL